MYKVLVTDVESRKGFDIVNIVQLHYGFDCILCSPQDYKWKLPSIYSQKVYRLSYKDFSTFQEELKFIVSEFPNDTLIYLPVSETATRLFFEFLASNNECPIKFLLPSKQNFNICSDKGAFQKFCEEKSYPVPKSFNLDDFKVDKDRFQPVLVKPIRGQGSVGIISVKSYKELLDVNIQDSSNYIVQERIESDQKVTGAFFLCREGKIISSYCHQRIRTFPLNGGVTVCSKSVENNEILSIGEKLLEEMKWNGFAMIEFLFDRNSKDWKIIELNPRLWGSVMLSAFNESDLLKHYIELMMDKDFNSVNPMANHFIRWVFPFDLMNLIKGKIGLKEFLRFNSENTCVINWTYATNWRRLTYHLYFTFNIRSFKRYLKKISLGSF
jgi:predicted ATP-grasp superfamily ATP-dependent carboligase